MKPSRPWPPSPRLWPRQCGRSGKAFVILDGTLLPIDRIAADTPYYSGKHKRHGMNVQVLTDPSGRLLWASQALPGSRPDCRETAQNHRSPHRSRTQMLGGQGVSRRRRTRPRTVSAPAPQAVEAPPQHHPRQDPLSRRAGHGPQGVAPPAEAPLQHQPHHRCREGRPGPSPRINVRLEKAQ